MTISRSKLALVALATAVLPVSSACSSTDNSSTKAPTTQVEPGSSAPRQGNVPPIKVSLECGTRQTDNANDPEVFEVEHILLTNNDANVFTIENFVTPLAVRFTEESSDEFIDAVNLGISSMSPVELPIGAVGNAVIVYPGDTPEKAVTYFIDQTEDGTVSLSTLNDNTVSVRSAFLGGQPTADILYLEGSEEETSSFLEPGKDEWDNQPDAPVKPKSKDEVGFTKLKNGGAYLNRSLSDPSLAAGAQVFDPQSNTACVGLLGPIAREPRAIRS